MYRNFFLYTMDAQGYLSSTSVYVENSGGWVDEDSEVDEASPRVHAEQKWLDLDDGDRIHSHVFRLAGTT